MRRQFLNRANVGAAFNQACDKEMSEGMEYCPFGKPRLRQGISDGFLHQ